jgi:hypothetical protein
MLLLDADDEVELATPGTDEMRPAGTASSPSPSMCRRRVGGSR